MYKNGSPWQGCSQLTNSDLEISCSGRYLLVRMLVVFGRNPSQDTVQQLAGKIGMPVAALAKAQSELVDKGLARYAMSANFSRRHLGLSGSGKFRRGFMLDAEVVRQAKEREVELSRGNLAKRVEEVLCHLVLWSTDDRPVSARDTDRAPIRPPAINLPAGKKLPFQARLLLGVLLALADRHGIVWDCPTQKLSELTGMKGARVSRELRRLEELKLVHFRVPGINGRLFFHRSPGAIVLNINEEVVPRLDHGTLIPQQGVILQSKFSVTPILRIFRSSPKLRKHPRGTFSGEDLLFIEKVVQKFMSPPIIWDEAAGTRLNAAISAVNKVLIDEGVIADSHYARYRLCVYTTRLLQGQRSTLSVDDPLLTTIRDDIARPSKDGQVSGVEFSVAAAILFLCTHRFHSEIQKAFTFGVPSAVVPGPPNFSNFLFCGYELGRAFFPEDAL